MELEEGEESWPHVDELRNELLKALEKADDTGVSFGCRGTVEQAPNPGIEVEGLGVLGLPLSSREAETLIAKCRQSPFGKGEETVVDDSVRRSWELDSSQFSLTNPQWETSIANVVNQVYRGLGLTCQRGAVQAQLYKLLLYESGAFFKPHQDSEKVPGMFGTLVICLPSKHEGGKVLLTHNRRNYEFSSADASQFGTTFGAWYSDVLHEVEPVTSGIRMVLTYNLIQNSSMPQRAPDPDRKARIQKALEMWELASANNDPDYPPYIVHNLAYFYSKKSANIRMLKGHDAAQVRCLEAACKELDYSIYLAVFERTIQRDDEAGDEEFGRDEAFECITELDGTAIDVCPPYDSDCRLEEYDSDEEADESEHEGYTGNEGAPSTFWYRQTVVLLVPPSRKLGFGWTPTNKFNYAEDTLDALGVSAADDRVAKQQLYRLCHIILPDASNGHRWNKPYTNDMYSSYYSHGLYDHDLYKLRNNKLAQTCFEKVAQVALRFGWTDLYERVPLDQKMMPDALKALGTFLCTSGTNCITVELYRMIRGSINLAAKYDRLQKISQAFKDCIVELSAKASHKTQFDDWYAAAFADILATQHRANKADGVALGEIARTCQPEANTEILRKLNDASTQTIAAFVMSFTKEDPTLPSPTKHLIVQEALNKLWDGFQYTEAIRTHGAPLEALNEQELADIMDLTKKYGRISLSDAFSALSSALGKADSTYFGAVLCPFIQSIMDHEIASVIIEDDPDLFDAVSSYIQLALCMYIRRLVGDEPQEPKDWALPNRGCGHCQLCKEVGDFMANAKERTLRYPIVEWGRKHLSSEFRAETYYNSPKNDFDITIDKKFKPYVWVCTKVHRKFNTAFAKWKANRAEAKKRLRGIGGKDMVNLRTYLAENFDAIMSCQTESLPDLGSREMADKAPLNNIDASSLNITNNKGKRTFNGSGLGDEENHSGVKRARRQNDVPAGVEIVDLT